MAVVEIMIFKYQGLLTLFKSNLDPQENFINPLTLKPEPGMMSFVHRENKSLVLHFSPWLTGKKLLSSIMAVTKILSCYCSMATFSSHLEPNIVSSLPRELHITKNFLLL